MIVASSGSGSGSTKLLFTMIDDSSYFYYNY